MKHTLLHHPPQRPFGKTGLRISAIGFGAGHIGDPGISEKTVGTLLNTIIDEGVTLIDTARSYGLSEERIGRHLARRRKEFVLSTKIGYGIPGIPDWTPACITAGIDAALELMKTDYLDIVHFHSCPVSILQNQDLLGALLRGVEEGKVLVPAYSGDAGALDFAIETGGFTSIQTSLNICNQRVIDAGLKLAKKRGMGIIAKRPAANAPWRFKERPQGHYAEEYWVRWKEMKIDPLGMEWQELALRFAAHHSGVHSAIAGTANLRHMKQNIEYVGQGPLPKEMVRAIHTAFRRHDDGWIDQI